MIVSQGGELMQAGGFVPQKGVVYMQPAPALQGHQVVAGGVPPGAVRLVQQPQQQLLAGPQPQQQPQQVWVQQGGGAPQQVVQLRAQAAPGPQYILQQAHGQPQMLQQAPQPQVVYLQQQPALQQSMPQQPAFKPAPQLVQQPQQVIAAPGGAQAPAAPAPGSTVLVNINGTLRQATVLQNGALLLTDHSKPAMAPAPQPAPPQLPQVQQASQGMVPVQYVTAMPQGQQMVQQPQPQLQRVQMVQLPPGANPGGTVYVQQAAQLPAASAGMAQYVTTLPNGQQAQVLRPVTMSAAMTTGAMQALRGPSVATMPMPMSAAQPQQLQPGAPGQAVLLANGQAMLQQPHVLTQAQGRQTVQVISQAPAANGMLQGNPTLLAQPPQGAPTAMPAAGQVPSQAQLAAAPVSASTIFLGGGAAARPPAAAPGSVMLLPASSGGGGAPSQPGSARASSASVGVIGEAAGRSRAGSVSSPTSPLAAGAPAPQPASPPQPASSPRGAAPGAASDLSALGGHDTVMRLIAASALEAGMSPDQAIAAGLCRPDDRDALAAAIAAEASGAAAPAGATPMSADAMVEGFGGSKAPSSVRLADLAALRRPASAGGDGGTFNAFAFSLFGGAGGAGGLGGLTSLSAGRPSPDDGAPGGAPDQLMPVAAATLKLPAAAAAAAAASSAGPGADAAAAMIAGLGLGDLPGTAQRTVALRP